MENNIEINTFDFENIKRFILFENYYQEMMSSDHNNEINNMLNLLMDYHFNKIYGSKYNNNYSDICDIKYQCIVSFSDQFN